MQIMNKGFSLIEVLVAICVLSFGILGIAGLQVVLLLNIKESYWQSLAALQINSAAEILIANAGAIQPDDLISWQQINAEELPEGKGSWECHKTTCIINLSWNKNPPRVLRAQINL